MSQPWLKFYPADWRADPRLRMCSIGARGLWIEMLCLMHEAEPYGHLLINGKPVTNQQLAGLAGIPLREANNYLGELRDAGVFSFADDSGVMFSRRMVRDREKAERDKANGKGGGNPRIKPPLNGGVNPPDNGEDKAQIPEARYQKLDSEKKDIRTIASATRPPASPKFEEFWKAYPKRDGANPKASARKLFEGFVKGGVPPDEIIGGVKLCAVAEKKNIGTPYIPQAVRWLRDRRWEDYLASETAKPALPQIAAGCPSWDDWRAYYRDTGQHDRAEIMDRFAREGRPMTFPSERPPDVSRDHARQQG